MGTGEDDGFPGVLVRCFVVFGGKIVAVLAGPACAAGVDLGESVLIVRRRMRLMVVVVVHDVLFRSLPPGLLPRGPSFPWRHRVRYAVASRQAKGLHVELLDRYFYYGPTGRTEIFCFSTRPVFRPRELS